MKDITAKQANLFTKKPMILSKKYKKSLMKRIWATATEGYFQTRIEINAPSEREAVKNYLEELGYICSDRLKWIFINWDEVRQNNE